ncbi:helix-turn-helix domain-containing protein [Vibrio jasicida]|uniref:helix-turn-helix domain-containing protein n=1 Tax=Vibrio jasicida TaxID=766224 RepID=UPI000CE37F12|nr:helix-turn-helix transcriptional regulator [Vibrio jasicida]
MKSNFSQLLRMARKRRGWAQRELVERLRNYPFPHFAGLDVNAISRWESEKVKPTSERMVQILRVLEISVDELKECSFPAKLPLIKRFERYRYDHYGLIHLPEGTRKWRRLNEKGRENKVLKQLYSLTEYKKLLTGKEYTDLCSIGNCAIAYLTYRVEGEVFILIHMEAFTYSAFISSIKRLIELLFTSKARMFLMIAPDKKAMKQARILQLKEVGVGNGIYYSESDHVLGELLTIISWDKNNNIELKKRAN